ncbi:hypothetical protein CRUP_024174 [Coryphaenoides rupestris]|nr:hypothetical protein CRUP_024174 [Coryphaenoides rupestris]
MPEGGGRGLEEGAEEPGGREGLEEGPEGGGGGAWSGLEEGWKEPGEGLEEGGRGLEEWGRSLEEGRGLEERGRASRRPAECASGGESSAQQLRGGAAGRDSDSAPLRSGSGSGQQEMSSSSSKVPGSTGAPPGPPGSPVQEMSSSSSKVPGSTGAPPGPPGSPVVGPPGSPLDLDVDEPQSSLTEVSQMWVNFGKSFLVIFPIYVLGYLEFSFSWVLVGLAVLFWWQKNHGKKDYRINRALAFLQPQEDAERHARLPTTDLPPWVHFPDVERVEWLNKTWGTSFVGNTEIDVDIKKYYCRAGIKSIQLQGVLRVVMDPLLGDMPLIGAVTVFFLKKPGVLRIHFLEAQDLLGKDKFLGGLIKGKSDPYGVIKIGNELLQSKVVHESVHPKWNEVYEVLVYEHTSQQLEIELFDEDTDKDDFLGRLVIDIVEVEKEKKVDEWFELEDVSTGKLHLKLEYLTPVFTAEHLDQALASIKAGRGQANDGLSSALLVVFLDSARNLPRNPLEFNQEGLKKGSVSKAIKSGKKVSSEPNPFIQFKVGHKTFESKIRYKTNSPVWEEAFTFLIHDPRSQELEVEVKDEKHSCSLGTLVLSLETPASSPTDSAPSSVQVRKGSTASATLGPASPRSPAANPPRSASLSEPEEVLGGPDQGQGGRGAGLGEAGRSSSNLAISGSHQYLAGGPGGKEPTPSIASDISNPYAVQELQQRLHQLHNGSGPHFPLGEVQLTLRHSSQRNKLVVVVHSCRNLIAFSDHGSDPYVRLYLLPDKRRSGRQENSHDKEDPEPRLRPDVLVDLSYEDMAKGWTQWYELSEDGMRKPHHL